MEIHSDEGTGISSVTVEIPVKASSAFVWDVVRDIYAADTRLIPGFATGIAQGPGTRVVTFANGLTVTERIVELDDRSRRLRYQAIDGPTTHHLATMVVKEDEQGVRLVWTTEFTPASLLDVSIPTIRRAADLMERTINAAWASEPL